VEDALSSSRATRLLILSRGAGSMSPQVEAKLRSAFADYLIVALDHRQDFEKLISPRARVVVAGGDGSIGTVARMLAGTMHPLGILSLGTFNNFAGALGLPTGLDDAIQVVKKGRARAMTLGRVNGKVFLQACAIGLFGETIALGESAKDRAAGTVAPLLRKVVAAKPFRYELAGDLEGSGTAMSLVFTNTFSIGSQLPVSDTTPADPYLEFSVHAGKTRLDIVGRALASALLAKHREEGSGQVFRFKTLRVTTKPRVRVYADSVVAGRTPATISAEARSLRVILPR